VTGARTLFAGTVLAAAWLAVFVSRPQRPEVGAGRGEPPTGAATRRTSADTVTTVRGAQLPHDSPVEVSRAFLGAYVEFIHGRLGPDRLLDASPHLRHQLAGLRPDPAGPRARGAPDSRLLGLRLVNEDRDRVRATASIQDGAAVYRVKLDLDRRRATGWTVTGMRESG